ncbi:MAG: 30S ribosomal protein S20 [Planctomycetes bacterium]|nr:30S ribosomal protein S20 [Planctomycetota bacterium]
MAHTLSAKKRIRQTAKRTLRNKRMKSQVKTQIKKVLEAVAAGNSQTASATFKSLSRLIDKAGAKGALHANSVSRRKSRLASKVNALAKAKPAAPAAPAAPKA